MYMYVLLLRYVILHTTVVKEDTKSHIELDGAIWSQSISKSKSTDELKGKGTQINQSQTWERQEKAY